MILVISLVYTFDPVRDQFDANFQCCWFSPRDHLTTKSPQIADATFFDSRNGYSSVMLVKLPIFGFLVISLAKEFAMLNNLHVIHFGNIEIFELQLLRQNYD